MGIEKIGTSIGKEIIAWARTGGKGLLAARPVKINTCGLKYLPALEKDVVQLSSYLLSEYKINSKTMKTLYSSEFKLPKELNKDGFYSTSVIDKKTGIPVKVYVKRTGQQIPAQTGDYEGEQWEIFTKNKNGEYESLGTRIFEIDRKNKKIGAGWMDSDGNNGRYSGIGIRLHQIAIERMIQENFANIEILTKPEAFPFHYKCGFRVLPETEQMTQKEFNAIFHNMSKETGIDEKVLKGCAVYKKNNGNINIDSQTYENIRKLLYLKYPGTRIGGDMPMILPKEYLEKWEQMCRLQPIIL